MHSADPEMLWDHRILLPAIAQVVLSVGMFVKSTQGCSEPLPWAINLLQQWPIELFYIKGLNQTHRREVVRCCMATKG
jgi:hypothetical protein